MDERNRYQEETKDVIREFLKKNGRCGYEKLQGSSYQGFLYERKIKETNRTITFDIRLPDEGSMVFEAASEIHVLQKSHLPAIKRYCQERIKVNYGAVNVNGDSVQFHIEDFIVDNPISIQTLEAYETEAIRVLELHYENLSNLANGKVLSIMPVKGLGKEIKDKKNRFVESIDSIRDYLSNRSSYNAICEKIDENNNTVFYCQVMAPNESFRLSFNISNDGILILKGTYGENAFVVPEAYRYAVADYINDENAKHKYGALSIGSDDEGVSFNICTSLLDGVIRDRTIKYMEGILLQNLSSSFESIETIGNGFILKDEKKNERMANLAKLLSEDKEAKDLLGIPGKMGSPLMSLLGDMNPFEGLPDLESSESEQSTGFSLDDQQSADDDMSMCEFADDLETDVSEEPCGVED